MPTNLKRTRAPSGGERIPQEGPQLRATPPQTEAPSGKQPNVVPSPEEGGIFSEIFKSIMLLQVGRKQKIQEVIDNALQGKTGQ